MDEIAQNSLVTLEANTLETCSAVAHDQWVVIDEICWEQETGLLTIPIRSPSRGSILKWIAGSSPLQNAWARIKIRNVISLQIADSARIGSFDINRIVFDRQTHAVVIHGNIPVTVTATIRPGVILDEATKDTRAIP